MILHPPAKLPGKLCARIGQKQISTWIIPAVVRYKSLAGLLQLMAKGIFGNVT